MIRSDNFVCIQGWMVTDLKLKGNELLIYAIIYGFSQDGESEYTGSRSYLAEWTNSTKYGVTKALQSLCEKGILVKKETIVNGVKFCSYRATKLTGVGNKVDWGEQQSCPGGGQQSCPNNIGIDNKEDMDGDNIPPLTPQGDDGTPQEDDGTPQEDDGFAAFWNAYPKKVGKVAAEKAFRKHRAKLPIMLKALEIHKKSIQWQKDGGQYIPHPATWLNQQRWDDEVEQESTGNIFIDVLKGVGE